MPNTSTRSCTVSEASIARLKQIAWPQAAAHAACRPPAFRVRSRDVRLEPAAITLCRNGRLLRTTTCSRAFGRRDRADAGGPRLYLETEWRQGHRANFASADLSGQDFSGLNLRGIKMDRAVL